jgi:hypothetical protein
MTAAEFDITGYLVAGENDLAVVHKANIHDFYHPSLSFPQPRVMAESAFRRLFHLQINANMAFLPPILQDAVVLMQN